MLRPFHDETDSLYQLVPPVEEVLASVDALIRAGAHHAYGVLDAGLSAGVVGASAGVFGLLGVCDDARGLYMVKSLHL